MPNAKDVHPMDTRNIFLWGEMGTGKTTQLLTLPGKKFLFGFDPAVAEALAGYDVDYEMFLPDEVNLNVTSMSKGKVDRTSARREPKEWVRFAKFFDEFMVRGRWKEYDIIALDSLTTFSQMAMDRVLYINQREGMIPQLDDWMPQMSVVYNHIRKLCSIPKTVFVTGHEETSADRTSGIVDTHLVLTGKLKAWLPLLFSDVFRTVVKKTKDGPQYTVQTQKEPRIPGVRTALRGVEAYEDVTVHDWTQPERYGLGALYKRTLGKTPENKERPVIGK